MTPFLVVALAVAAPGPKGPPKNEPPGLTGRWAIESASLGGVPLPKIDETVTYTADGRYVTRTGDGATKFTGTFTADPKKEPAELDVTEPAGAGGKVSALIYKVDGDSLTVCARQDGQRPTSFNAPAGTKVLLLVFKRIKD